jgi:hypothetical protein
MLSKDGPHLNLNRVPPAIGALGFTVCLVLKIWIPLPIERFLVLLINVIGTSFLASGFDVHIPKMGDGGWWDSLKWAAKELPEYGTQVNFNVLRLYIGLTLLLVGIILSTGLS